MLCVGKFSFPSFACLVFSCGRNWRYLKVMFWESLFSRAFLMKTASCTSLFSFRFKNFNSCLISYADSLLLLFLIILRAKFWAVCSFLSFSFEHPFHTISPYVKWGVTMELYSRILVRSGSIFLNRFKFNIASLQVSL